MPEIRRTPCLSDGAIAALREDLLEAKIGVPMVLAWDYVYKALDEIARLRAREVELQLTISGKTFYDPTDARVAKLETRLESVKAKATDLLVAATEVSGREIQRLKEELRAAKIHLTALSTEPFGLTPEQAADIKAYVAEQNAKMAKDCLVVGQFYRHPHSDRLLQVTDGSYLGGYKRVSNWWRWSYFDEDFLPVGELDQGYGWSAKPVERPQVCDHCGVPANKESDRDEQCSVCGKGDDR